MRTFITVATLAILPAVVLIGCEDEGPEVETFSADLSGTGTNATGTATFSLTGNSLTYELEVENIDEVTAAHIHNAESEDVMVGLFAGPTTGTDFTSILEEATLTVVDSVITHMRNGTAYVNVHTVANPGGEIQGTIDID